MTWHVGDMSSREEQEADYMYVDPDPEDTAADHEEERAYVAHDGNGQSPRKSRFLTLDFETGSTVPGQGAPVSIGLALFEGGEPKTFSEWFLKPPRKKGVICRQYTKEAEQIHGHTVEQLEKDGLEARTLCQAVRGWCQDLEIRDTPIWAFSAAFDMGFCADLLFLGGSWDQAESCWVPYVSPLLGPWHCGLMKARADLMLSKCKLDNVAAYYGLSREDGRHGALTDALLLGKCVVAGGWARSAA